MRIRAKNIDSTVMNLLPMFRLKLLTISLTLIVTTKAFTAILKYEPKDFALGVSRRQLGVVLGECLVFSTRPVFAASDPGLSNLPLTNSLIGVAKPQSSNFPDGLLESRLSSNVMEPPPFGMESTDIFYPS